MAAPAHIARENGRKGGRPVGSKATHTIQAEAGKAALIATYLANINPINQALVNKAKEGDIQAIRELHDRVYGRAMQAIEHSGKVEITQISGMKIIKE
jgi:hypothetical protein